MNSWSDPFDLNFGWLEGLSDLATETSYVRNRIADYFSDLISIGFSGFRIDAAKHICPDDLAAIFSLFKERMGGQFPDDFISYLEVLIGGEKDLLMCQYSNYQYSQYFDDAMQKAGLSVEDISKIKIWECTLSYIFFFFRNGGQSANVIAESLLFKRKIPLKNTLF